ncbi:MAG: LysM peptidoglycan-binding domain-containing protein [Gammaproteobacteria bacterium]|nr:LysM peptidoglycan-binding domain-containing protein [Gammaproteobacteria bacterium]
MNPVLAALAIVFVISLSPPARAHHLLANYPLLCDATFPCPVEIKRRIDFWVEVFSKWGSGQLILHDSRHPERVYRVLKTKAHCSRRREAASVKNARLKIRKDLRILAERLEKTGKPLASQRHLAKLFVGETPSEIRRAGDRIRCQEGNRDRFAKALVRFGTYRGMVQAALKSAGLPSDIQYLPFVESAYNPNAYSRLGAAGMWQIMPRTGRKLGLKTGADLDERLDPRAASRAAARYLSESMATMKTLAPGASDSLYPFVITSYNYGVQGTSRALKSMGPDFVKVLTKYKGRSFRVAVKNFYASFLAARHVARNMRKFFPDIKPAPALRYAELPLQQATSVARLKKVLGVSEKELQYLNPGLRRLVWQGHRHVPAGYRLAVPPRAKGWRTQLAALSRLPAEKQPYSEYPYRVRRGDTACAIARRHHVACRDLVEVNSLGRRALIRVGQILTIPGPGGARGRPAATRTVSAAAGGYRVQRGDTACGIARSFGVNCAELIRSNGLGRGALIRVGQVLSIPGAAQPAVASAKPPVAVATRKPAPPPAAKKVAEEVVATVEEPEAKPEMLPEIPAAPEAAELAEAFGIGEDLFVTVRKAGGQQRYFIRVEPEETVGHYADWLGMASIGRLRRSLGLKSARRITIGQRLELPLRDEEQRKHFEQRRVEFHHTLETGFRENFVITGIESYRLRSGDNAWSIAEEHEIPLWLLRRFNPDLVFGRTRAGARVRVPVVEPRSAGDEPMKVTLGGNSASAVLSGK